MQSKPDFEVGQWVFTNKQQLTANANPADSMTTSSYTKLQHQTTGSYRILEANPNTIVIDKDVGPNTVLTY